MFTKLSRVWLDQTTVTSKNRTVTSKNRTVTSKNRTQISHQGECAIYHLDDMYTVQDVLKYYLWTLHS